MRPYRLRVQPPFSRKGASKVVQQNQQQDRVAMPNFLKQFATCVTLLAALIGFSVPGQAQTPSPRLALVIGNSGYTSAPLATGANDAGLIAQTLQSAGFDVTAASDLNLDSLRAAFRDFLDKAQSAGRDSVLFVYLSGRGVQYAGDNFFVPVDAVINRDTDVPLAALRLSDYLQAISGLPAKARIFVLDAARGNNFAKDDRSGGPLAGGLSLIEAPAGALYAMNATPGTIAADEQGPYGVYAQALVEMMQLGLPIDQVFERARLRVNALTAGAVVPWDDSRITAPIAFFGRAPNAAALPSVPAYDSRPLSGYSPAEAYLLVVDRDTITAYEEFLVAFPRDPLVPRVRALLAARREALTWWRAYAANTPDAYWSYMRRYPHGPHYWDARRRLILLSAALQPPAQFIPYGFDGLPPPPEDEYVIVDHPIIVLEEPDYPPPPPVLFLPPQPTWFAHLPPPHPAPRGSVPLPISAPLAHPQGRPGAITPPNLSPPGGPHAPPNHAAPEHAAPNVAPPAPHPSTPPVPPPAPPPAPRPLEHGNEKPVVPPHPAVPPPHPPEAHPAVVPKPEPPHAPPPKPEPPRPAVPPPHPAAPPPHPAPPPPKPAAPPAKPAPKPEPEHKGEEH
jgi:uncharacterized caspase-like protein